MLGLVAGLWAAMGIVLGAGPASPLMPSKGVEPDRAERLGREWEFQLAKGDVSSITSRVDLTVIAAKALASIPGPTEGRRAFITQYAAGAALNLETALRGFGTFRFLGVVRTNAAGGMVFRGLQPNGAVNFHRYVLETKPNDEVGIADIFVVANGEWLSDSIRWLYLLSEGKGSGDLAAKLEGVQAELVRNAAAVERIAGLAQGRKHLELLAACKQLPLVLREDRTLLQMQLAAAQEVDPAEFSGLAQTWLRLYPRHPGLDVLTFERLAMRGENAKSAAALERIELFVGGDPHLRALRAAQLAASGQVDVARRLAAEAMQLEPVLATGYDVAIGIGLKEKRWAEVIRVLDQVGDHLPVDPREVVKSQPQYEAFRTSAEGKKWLNQRPAVNIPTKPVREGATLPVSPGRRP